MEKLKLEHLAPYLPYGLNGIDYFQEHKLIRDINCNNVMSLVDGDTKLKPILRPLSELTKEIEHNGERFVPSKALSCWDLDGISLIDIPHIPVNLYELFLKWHFDVFGLIDKGLAIDINTI